MPPHQPGAQPASPCPTTPAKCPSHLPNGSQAAFCPREARQGLHHPPAGGAVRGARLPPHRGPHSSRQRARAPERQEEPGPRREGED